MDTLILENVDSVNLMGVHVDKYLTWEDHVTKTGQKQLTEM